MSAAPATARELFWLKAGTAYLWLTTWLGVLHPQYRRVGHDWLARLGLPDGLMWLTCAGELALGFAILALPPKGWLMAAQVAGVTVFTVNLAALEPMLLVHPFGMLSKNYPFIALVLPALVSWQDPLLWFHPFGPLTRNLPIIVGTLGVLNRCPR